MTMLAHSTAQHETPGVIDFTPDMPVVRDTGASDPANGGRASRFSDESWRLYPAARKPTARTSINFGSSPPAVQRCAEAAGVLRGESRHAHG